MLVWVSREVEGFFAEEITYSASRQSSEMFKACARVPWSTVGHNANGSSTVFWLTTVRRNVATIAQRRKDSMFANKRQNRQRSKTRVSASGLRHIFLAQRCSSARKFMT